MGPRTATVALGTLGDGCCCTALAAIDGVLAVLAADTMICYLRCGCGYGWWAHRATWLPMFMAWLMRACAQMRSQPQEGSSAFLKKEGPAAAASEQASEEKDKDKGSKDKDKKEKGDKKDKDRDSKDKDKDKKEKKKEGKKDKDKDKDKEHEGARKEKKEKKKAGHEEGEEGAGTRQSGEGAAVAAGSSGKPAKKMSAKVRYSGCSTEVQAPAPAPQHVCFVKLSGSMA